MLTCGLWASTPETLLTIDSSIVTFTLYNCVVVTEYIKKYATEEALREQEHNSSSSESSMSDFSEDEAQDMEL